MSELRLSGISFDEINAERGLPLGAGGQEQEWAATVAIALERMERCLAADRSVVIDDTFCCRWLRRRFCEAARRAGAEPWVLHLETASEVLRRRYRDLQASGERPVLSPAVFAAHLRTFEPPAQDEPVLRCGSREEAFLRVQRMESKGSGPAP